ncbi:MAG: pitrilysin family protein [Spirochaetes bacterium]|nr:pitrilysin family protein [Spirochaetota bacterium]
MIRRLSWTISFLLAAAALSAEPTSVPGLHRFALENGLELFVLERHEAPTVHVRLSFRCGAYAQTAVTAGSFHLLEHMLFTGNGLTPGESAFSAGLAAVGASGLEGGSGEDGVSIAFSVPSGELDAALRLWAAAVAAPAFDDAELAGEKKVIASEIAAALANPDLVYEAAVDKRLLRLYPWRADVYGNPGALDQLDAAGLGALHAKYFVPNNAMLFIGGDIDPEAAFAVAWKAFGSWKAAEDPWKTPLPRQAVPGVTRPLWIVYPDPGIPAGTGRVELRYRGPDAAAEPAAARAAELLMTLLSSPDGRFSKSIMKSVPGAVSPDDLRSFYRARRDGASTSFILDFAIPNGTTVSEIAQRYFKEQVRGAELFQLTREAAYFSKAEYETAWRRIADARELALETPESLGAGLSSWWAAASADFWLTLPDDTKKLGAADLQAFVRRFFMQNLEITALRVNPVDYERDAKVLAQSGFELITPETAFWWKKK